MMSRLIETEGRWIRALLVLATLTVALVFIGLAADAILYFSDIILILVMAWVFAFVLSPVVGGIKRFLPAAPRTLVVVTVYALLFLILGTIGLLIATQLAGSIVSFTDELPALQESLPELVAPWQERLRDIGLQVDLELAAAQALDEIAASSGQFVGPLQDLALASLGMLGNLMFMIFLSLLSRSAASSGARPSRGSSTAASPQPAASCSISNTHRSPRHWSGSSSSSPSSGPSSRGLHQWWPRS